MPFRKGDSVTLMARGRVECAGETDSTGTLAVHGLGRGQTQDQTPGQMKGEILDEAQNDLLDGFRFYENQSEGLGDYFLDSLRRLRSAPPTRLMRPVRPLVVHP